MRKIKGLLVLMLMFLLGIVVIACDKNDANYKFSRIEWKKDGSGATVILVDENDSSSKKEVNVDVTLVDHKDATCSKKATNTYSLTYEGVTYTKEIEFGDLAEHDWEFSEFVWADNYKSAKALLVCKNDSSHTKEVDAKVTSKVKTDPTCGELGVTTYTATYESHEESKDAADIKMKDHEYQFDHFSWNDDYTAKAILVCKNDSTHIKEKNAVVTSKIVKTATCEEAGQKEYTATYLTYTETKNVEIEPLGHKYEFDHFVWADDYSSAKAVLVCKNDSTHIKEEAATVTSKVKFAATCDQVGTTTYTAVYESNTESKDVTDIQPLGHKYQFDHFVWAEDYQTAKVILICENDSTHTKEEAATVVVDQKEGYVEYIAAYGQNIETKKFNVNNEEIYTVQFKNVDGTVVSTVDYKAGEAVVAPENPTYDDNTYTYVFKSWDKEVESSATKSATYTAVYEKTYKEYEITFVNYNDEVISKKTYHYGDDVELPVNPNKPADETYTYSFTSWDSEVIKVNGNKTYKAQFGKEYIAYFVKFIDHDNKVLAEKNDYHYGDDVELPANPTRDADNTYTYSFDDWDKEVTKVTGNMAYYAKYKPEYIDYFVKFMIDDQEYDVKSYHYNDELVKPINPNKPADETYSYEFAGWDKEVLANVTDNLTYTATWTKTYIEYEIKFVNYNGDVLSKVNYHYGDEVVAPTEGLTRPSDLEFDYEFAGWDKKVEKVTKSTTYTAEYSSTNIEYTIVFKNGDDVLSSTKYYYNQAVEEPTVADYKDNVYEYKFAGWDKALSRAVEDATYTAQFTKTYREYTIIFTNWNGSIISKANYHYEDEVELPENPTKGADNTYTYEFTGWDSEVTKVTESTTYKAQYKETYIDYEVKFVDYDDKEISKKTYHYGDEVELPENPTRQADAQYTYRFENWTDAVTVVYGDYTYKAYYLSIVNVYTVKFVDEDGKTILHSQRYDYGTKADAIYQPQPTKNADNTYTYDFNGWDKNVADVTGDATYTATYKPTYIDYEVVFLGYNDVEISKKTYHYNDQLEEPQAPESFKTSTTYYEFKGWDKEVSEKVEKTVTYTATFTETERKNHSVSNMSKLDKIYDGNPIAEPTFTVTGDGDYEIQYSLDGKDEYSSTRPSAIGKYKLRITFEETNLYLATEIDYDFEITYESYTYIYTGFSQNFPRIMVRVDELGIISNAFGLNDIGYKFINDYDIIGSNIFELLDAYNQSLTDYGLDYLFNKYLKQTSYELSICFSIATTTENQTSLIKTLIDEYIEDELDDAACPFTSWAGTYKDIFSVQNYEFVCCKDIDDVFYQLDDYFTTYSQIKSSNIVRFYDYCRYIYLLENLSNYYMNLLSKIEDDAAANYIGQLGNIYTTINSLDLLYEISNEEQNPYYTALKTEYNDALLGYIKSLKDFGSSQVQEQFESIVEEKDAALFNRNLELLGDTFYQQMEKFNNIVTSEDFIKLTKDYVDNDVLLNAICDALDHADNTIFEAIQIGLDQNVYYLDQNVIVGDNLYYHVDENAQITYIFNKDSYNGKTYNLGYIIDGVYTLDEALDDEVEKYIRDILICEFKDGYIDYENYRGYGEFNFDFAENKFDTYEGELVYLAYGKSFDGSQLTFRLNKNGDKLIGYTYAGHWTKEEIVKRVTEPVDNYFGQDTTWYYDNDFVVVQTPELKYIFVVDENNKDILKPYELEFDYEKDIIFAYFYEEEDYIIAFVDINNDKYVFYYLYCDMLKAATGGIIIPKNGTPIVNYNLIIKGEILPSLGLDGATTWKHEYDLLLTSNDNENVYELIENNRKITPHASTDVYKEEVVYNYNLGLYDKGDFVAITSYRLITRNVVVKNGDVQSGETWLETADNVYFVINGIIEKDRILAKPESGHELTSRRQYKDITKELIASGDDYGNQKVAVYYIFDGIDVLGFYDKGNKAPEELILNSPQPIYMATVKDNIIYAQSSAYEFFFELDGDKLTPIVPNGYHLNKYVDYDGFVFGVELWPDDKELEFDDDEYFEGFYDEKYYYTFDKWVIGDIDENNELIITATYTKTRRTANSINNIDVISKKYDEKAIDLTDKIDYDGYKEPTYEFKIKGADDDAYTKEAPSELGHYVLRVTVPESEKYLETVKTFDFDISLDTKQIVMFNYLSAILFVVDETGFVEDQFVADASLALVFEKYDFKGLNILDATSKLIDALDELGYFSLKTEDTASYSKDLAFGCGIISTGEYSEIFVYPINEIITFKLNLSAGKYVDLMSPSDYLRNYFFLASGELVTLSGIDMMNMVINNMSLMNRNSEGFAIFTNVYEGIYMLYAELDALVEYLGAGNYDAATYGELMQAAIDARNDMNEVLEPVFGKDSATLKRLSYTSPYLYYRNDYYNALKTYLNAYANNDEAILARLTPTNIMELYDAMDHAASSTSIASYSFTIRANTKFVNAQTVIHDNVELIEDVLKAEKTTFAALYQSIHKDYKKMVDELTLEHDYDLDKMPFDIANVENSLTKYYLNNPLTNETFVFKDLYENSSFKDTDYRFVCYVYKGQYNLEQLDYMTDAKLLRFFTYEASYNSENHCDDIKINDYQNLIYPTLEGYSDDELAKLPEIGRGELVYVAYVGVMDETATLGLFIDGDQYVGYTYEGNYTFENVSKGNVEKPEGVELTWFFENGRCYVEVGTIVLIFVVDENDSRLLVEYDEECELKEIKYSYADEDVRYVYAVTTDGQNVFMGFTGKDTPTDKNILDGQAFAVFGKGGYITWELLNDKVLVKYINNKLNSACYVKYDEQTNTYTFADVDKKDLKEYAVSYTYSTDLYSYLFITGNTYLGDTYQIVYKFNGELTEEKMITAYEAKEYTAEYTWNEHDNSVTIYDGGNAIVSVFEIRDEKLVEITNCKPQIYILRYAGVIYLITDEHGIVTNAYGHAEATELFVKKHDLKGVYIKDALINYLKGLDEDGYFDLFVDIFNGYKAANNINSSNDSILISYCYEDKEMFDEVSDALKDIRQDVSIRFIEYNCKSELLTVSLMSESKLNEMTEEEAIAELIDRFNEAGKYASAVYKALVLYYKDVYTFTHELYYYREALGNIGGHDELAKKVDELYLKFRDLGIETAQMNGGEEWTFAKLLELSLPRHRYYYENNDYYTSLIAALAAAKNHNEFELMFGKLLYTVFNPKYISDTLNERVNGYYAIRPQLIELKENLYKEINPETLTAIYAKIKENHNLTKAELFAKINEEYEEYCDDVASLCAFNCLEKHPDCITRWEDFYQVEYIYHDAYANETWLLVKWSVKDSEGNKIEVLNSLNSPYQICFVFDGLYSKKELFDSSIDKEIIRFFEYETRSEYILFDNPQEIELTLGIVDGELQALTPQGNLLYICRIEMYGTTMIYGFYDDGKAYEYYGNYSFKEIENNHIRPFANQEYEWVYNETLDLYIISEHGMEYVFISGEDPYTLVTYMPNYDEIEYVMDFEEMTLVFVKEGDNNYCYFCGGSITEDDFINGNCFIAMGARNELTWIIINDVIVLYRDNKAYYSFTEAEDGFKMHMPHEILEGHVIDSYYDKVENESYLFAEVYTYDCEWHNRVYAYTREWSRLDMINDYTITPDYETGTYPHYYNFYGFKTNSNGNATDIYVYYEDNNQIVYQFTVDSQGNIGAYNQISRDLQFVYYTEDNKYTYALYTINSYNICYKFDCYVSQNELTENLEGLDYTKWFWSQSSYIKIADLDGLYKSSGSRVLREVKPLTFKDEPEIKYVINDSGINPYGEDYEYTYILFIADGINYLYGYEGELTEDAFGTVQPKFGIEGEYIWEVDGDRIYVLDSYGLSFILIYNGEEYIGVEPNEIESYEIKYTYTTEESIYVFVEYVNYAEEVYRRRFEYDSYQFWLCRSY